MISCRKRNAETPHLLSRPGRFDFAQPPSGVQAPASQSLCKGVLSEHTRAARALVGEVDQSRCTKVSLPLEIPHCNGPCPWGSPEDTKKKRRKEKAPGPGEDSFSSQLSLISINILCLVLESYPPRVLSPHPLFFFGNGLTLPNLKATLSYKKSPFLFSITVMDVENDAPLKPIDQETQDACDLAAFGHDQGLGRNFNIWSMLALAFCVLGTWSTFAQDLSDGLETGGPVAILWGLCLVTFCNTCVALSLGEICSSMPTALGQAYWVYRLWETPLGRFTSYMCAWINVFGWWTLAASQIAFMTQFLLGMKVMFNTEWTGASTGWLDFVVYIGLVFALTLINVVGCRKDKFLPWLNNFVGVWFVGLFFVFILALLITTGVRSGLKFQPGSFVFGKWINQTGWSDGVVWFMGLVQAAYGLTAFDAVIHMVEEIPAPRKNAPKVMYYSILSGAVTGFVFMMVCLFCIQNVGKVIDSPTGQPFMELTQETVGLTGAAVLMALFIMNGLGQAISIMTTASRLTWGFARDGGLPFSGYLTKLDPYWKAPVRALWFQGSLIALVGVLFTFASTVLNAILSVSTIALTISYGFPIATVMVQGRDKLPPGGHFHLGKFATPANWVSIIYCCITTVFFFFPTGPNPSPSNMNWAIAVFGIMLVIALGFWLLTGRRTYLNTEESFGAVIQAQEGAVIDAQAAGPSSSKRDRA